MLKRSLAALAAFVIALPAFPAVQEAVGTVNTLRAHDGTLWGVDVNYITIDGLASAGTCTTSNGLVTLTIRGDKSGDKQIAVALSAKAMGKKVRVSFDPTYVLNGSCLLRWVEFAE